MRIGENEKRLTKPTFSYTAYDDTDNIGKAATSAQTQRKVTSYAPSEAVMGTKTSGGAGSAGYGIAANANQPYIDQLNSLYDQIMGRGPFQYDLNGDLLYRQMADQYTQLGRQAMRNTTGTAAGLTGGYGNSYATQAGSQEYQNYLTQLNAQIPYMYDRAYTAWKNQGDDLVTQYNLALAHPGNVGSLTPKAYSGGGTTTTAADDTTQSSGFWQKAIGAATQNANTAKDSVQSVLGSSSSAIGAANPLSDYYKNLALAQLEQTKLKQTSNK